jgi:hypothetical protein
MDEHVKYRSLVNSYKDEAQQALTEFKYVVVREKVDGANSSVREPVEFDIDENGVIRTYSRNGELTGEDGLKGFREFAKEHFLLKYLPKNCRVYAEWLVPHKVKYPEEAYRKMYMFMVYDYGKKCYVDPLEYTELIMAALEVDRIEFAPLLYAGVYKGIEHIESLMNESKLGAEKPEGVVVVDYEHRNRFGNNVAVKFVNKEFVENEGKIKVPRIQTPEELVVLDFVNTTLTDNRVEKQILKFQDEGILPESLSLNDMGIVMKVLPKALVLDIFKEELDDLIKILPDSEEADLKKLVGNKVGKMTGQLARNYVINLKEG